VEIGASLQHHHPQRQADLLARLVGGVHVE